MLKTETEPKEVFLALAVEDIRGACDILRPTWDEVGENARDGWVSLEVDPNLAHDTQGTIDEAKRLHALVDRPEPVREDPGDEGGPARDRGVDRRGHPDQRHADLLARAPPRGRRGVRARRAAARGLRRRPRADGVRRLVLRLARRHRGRQAPRRDRRPRRAQGHARDRQRQARLRDLQAGVRRRAVGGAARQGRIGAALPVGVDVDEEPRVPRRDLRRGADRPRHRQHDAARDGRGVPGPRQGARLARGGRRRRAPHARGVRGGGDRLRRRRRDARARGRGEVRQVVPAALRRRRGQARRDGRRHERALRRARPAAAGGLRPRKRGRGLRPSHLLDVGRGPDGGAARRRLPAHGHEGPGQPGQRPPDLLQGPRLAAVLRGPQGGGHHRRRGAADVPQARLAPGGSPHAADPADRRRDRLARPGAPDRRRRGAGRPQARPPALPRLVPVRRLRDGRGVDLGGVRARRVQRPRQPHRDHRRQPARPDARDDGRLGPRPLRAARRGVRLERDRDRRPRHRRDRRRIRPGGRDRQRADRDRRADEEGQGRQGRRGPAGQARQAARRSRGGDRGARRRARPHGRDRRARGRHARTSSASRAASCRRGSSARRRPRARPTARR